MNEKEMAVTLGILPEPEKNRVQLDPYLRSELMFLQSIFSMAQTQKQCIGNANPDLWCELLPWHSMN